MPGRRGSVSPDPIAQHSTRDERYGQWLV
jgi:hypothetical protein